MGLSSNLLADGDRQEDLLLPVFTKGEAIYPQPSLAEIQGFCQQQLRDFANSNLAEYPVQLEPHLQAVKDKLLSASVDARK